MAEQEKETQMMEKKGNESAAGKSMKTGGNSGVSTEWVKRNRKALDAMALSLVGVLSLVFLPSFGMGIVCFIAGVVAYRFMMDAEKAGCDVRLYAAGYVLVNATWLAGCFVLVFHLLVVLFILLGDVLSTSGLWNVFFGPSSIETIGG